MAIRYVFSNQSAGSLQYQISAVGGPNRASGSVSGVNSYPKNIGSGAVSGYPSYQAGVVGEVLTGPFSYSRRGVQVTLAMIVQPNPEAK